MQSFIATLRAACRVLAGCAPLVALGNPLTDLAFTVDPAVSALGTVPLGGVLDGAFQVFDRTLTLASGQVGLGATYALDTSVQAAHVADGPGFSIDVTGGSVAAALPGLLSLGVTGGTVGNGIASQVSWTAQGAGSVTGSIDVRATVLGVATTTTLTFTANAAPSTAFTSTFSGPAVITDTASGARLDLPLRVPVALSNVQVQDDGKLGALFSTVRSYVQDTVATQLGSAFAPTGSVIATSVVHLPPVPEAVSYTVDPVRSLLTGGALSSALSGTVAARIAGGDVGFSGGSAIGFTKQFAGFGSSGSAAGATYAIAVGGVGLDVGFDVAAGLASNGSRPSALTWSVDHGVDHGVATLTGTASLSSPLASVVDAPFTLRIDLGLDPGTSGDASLVSVVDAAGVETLTLPFDFASFASRATFDLDFDAGIFGVLADLFADTLAPLIAQQALARFAIEDVSGVVVATRALATAPGGVPEPSVAWLVLAAGLAWFTVARPRVTGRIRRG